MLSHALNALICLLGVAVALWLKKTVIVIEKMLPVTTEVSLSKASNR